MSLEDGTFRCVAPRNTSCAFCGIELRKGTAAVFYEDAHEETPKEGYVCELCDEATREKAEGLAAST